MLILTYTCVNFIKAHPGFWLRTAIKSEIVQTASDRDSVREGESLILVTMFLAAGRTDPLTYGAHLSLSLRLCLPFLTAAVHFGLW